MSPEDFGAVGDGEADDTLAIRAAASEGGVITLTPGATYLLTDRVFLVSGTRFEGAGEFVAGSDLAWSYVFGFQGNAGVSGAAFDGVTFRKTGWDAGFHWLRLQNGGFPLADVEITNCVIDHSGVTRGSGDDNWAIQIFDCTGLSIVGNSQVGPLQLTGAGANSVLERFVITDNVMTSPDNAGISIAIADGGVRRHGIIARNTITDVLGVTGLGILVGLDGNGNDRNGTIENVIISQNEISLSGNANASAIFCRMPVGSASLVRDFQVIGNNGVANQGCLVVQPDGGAVVNEPTGILFGNGGETMRLWCGQWLAIGNHSYVVKGTAVKSEVVSGFAVSLVMASAAAMQGDANRLACAFGHDVLPGRTFTAAIGSPTTHYGFWNRASQPCLERFAAAFRGELPTVTWADYSLTEDSARAVIGALLISLREHDSSRTHWADARQAFGII